MENNKAVLVADSDPEFIALREDIRECARRAELFLRREMAQTVASFPVELAEYCGQMIIETPAVYIRGLLSLCRELSLMKDRLDASPPPLPLRVN